MTPVLFNYYFPRLGGRPLPLSHFRSCEYAVLMVLTAWHTCIMEIGGPPFPLGQQVDEPDDLCHLVHSPVLLQMGCTVELQEHLTGMFVH